MRHGRCFVVQAAMAGIEGVYPWLTLLTNAVAIWAGYRFYAWFIDDDN